MIAFCITVAIALIMGSTMSVTIEEVQQHASSSDCWSVIYDTVYDLTNYGWTHTRGGGPDCVWASCGVDYTNEFDRVHGDSLHYLNTDGIVEIGALISDPEPSPTEIDTPAPQTAEPKPDVTLNELSAHDNPENCWVLFYDQVFDLTEYAYRHPGPGEDAIHPWCGGNGTDAFAGAHDKTYLERIGNLSVGSLEANYPTPEPPQSLPVFSDDVVAEHDTPEDCWVVFYDSVYDMTQYAYAHPGPGKEAIHPWCGLDGTVAFDVFHKQTELAIVAYTKVGTMSTSSASMVRVLVIALMVGIIALMVG